jgi:hypothetical protein
MKLPIVILIALTATSCGKIRKALTIDKTKVEATTDQTVTEQIVTTEKVDTLITLPADTSTWILPLRELIDSTELIVENDVQTITFKFDPVKNTVKATAVIKEKTIPVVIDKKTVENRMVETESKVKVQTVKKDSEKVVTKPLIPSWLWIVLVIISAGYLAYRFMPMNIFRS